MKLIKTLTVTAMGYMLTLQQAFAQGDPGDPGACDPNCPVAIPEIDGSGAIIAIGLVVGLVALFREKYFNK